MSFASQLWHPNSSCQARCSTKRILSLWALPLLCAGLFIAAQIPFLGIPEIAGSSEAREVHVARIVFESGEWIAPLRNGVVPSKPPLFHWMVALLGHLTGAVTPFIARFISLVAAGAVVALTARLCGALLATAPAVFSERKWVPVVSAVVVLTTCGGFLQLSSDARVDMLYCAFVAIAWVFCVIGLLEERRIAPWRWNVFYLSCAAAVLTKGPLGFVLPALLVWTAVSATSGVRLAFIECLRPRWGWAFFGGIVGTWYYLAYQQMGHSFVEKQLFFENLQRFAGGEYINTEPFWFYLPSFLGSAAPWSFAFFAASFVWLAHKSSDSVFSVFATNRRIPIYLFWLGFLLFSLASGKRHAYLVPLFPCVAVAVAIWGQALILGQGDRGCWQLQKFLYVLRQVLFCSALLLVIAIELAPVWASFSPETQLAARWIAGEKGALQRSGLLALLMLFVVPFLRSALRRTLCFWTGSIVLVGTCFALGLGLKAEFKGFHYAAAESATLIPSESKFVVVRTLRDEFFDPFLFYIGRNAEYQAKEAIAVQAGTFLLYKRTDLITILERLATLGLKLEQKADFNVNSDALKRRTDRSYELGLVIPY